MARGKTIARLTKRVFDLVIAGLLLIVASPILLATAFLVLVCLGKPVIWRQRRAGWKGRPFVIYKFRTMRNACGPDGRLLPDVDRLTAVGRVLRATSLDELPELFNVLIGDMSLVGPRPLLERYLERYSEEQMRRHDVLPGLSGWAQVNGRNTVGWDERFKLDVWYVDHWTFGLDLKILAMTIWAVLRRKGISSDDHATMPEFFGAQQKRHDLLLSPTVQNRK